MMTPCRKLAIADLAVLWHAVSMHSGKHAADLPVFNALLTCQ